eukprot:scaffold7218_cov613-Prasinococcus_capsulatus_cf.AAC.5
MRCELALHTGEVVGGRPELLAVHGPPGVLQAHAHVRRDLCRHRRLGRGPTIIHTHVLYEAANPHTHK